MQNPNEEKKDAIKTGGWGQGSDLGKNDVGTPSSNDMGLHQRIMDAIRGDSTIDSSNITIRMRENDMVELCGTVPNESMSQRVEECVRQVEGVKGEIDNDLKIRTH